MLIGPDADTVPHEGAIFVCSEGDGPYLVALTLAEAMASEPKYIDVFPALGGKVVWSLKRASERDCTRDEAPLYTTDF